MEVGQIVSLFEEHIPRYRWPIARIIEVHKSEDGYIRSAKLVKSNGYTITRPAQKLYPLEAHAGYIDGECHIPEIKFPGYQLSIN